MRFTEFPILKTVPHLLAILCLAKASVAGDETVRLERSITADSDIQAQIRRVANAIAEGGLVTAHDELRRLEKIAGDNSRLVEQVALFVTTRSADEVMIGHAILNPSIVAPMNDIDDPSIVRGLAPFLDSRIREFVEDEFSMIDGVSPPLLPTPVSPANYGAYKHYIQRSLIQDQTIPDALSSFIYRREPGAAFLAFIYAHDEARDRDQGSKSQPLVEETKQLLWAEHIVGSTIWKNRHEFDEAFQKSKPDAVKQLTKLSKHEKWWVRLYAAEIMQQYPELRISDVAGRLKKDDNELVRQAATRKDSKPVK